MGDPLELVGKRVLLLIDDGRPASDTEPEKAVWARDWLRGTVQAVSVIGLSAPEVSGGDATSTSTAGGLTVSVYIQARRRRMHTFDSFHKHCVRFTPYLASECFNVIVWQLNSARSPVY